MTMDFEDLPRVPCGRGAPELRTRRQRPRPCAAIRVESNCSVGANDRPAALQTVGPWGDCHARRSAAHSTRSSRTPDHRGHAESAVRTTDYKTPVRSLLSASYAPVLLPVVIDTFEAADLPLSVSYDHGPNVVRAIDTGEADFGFLAPCPHPVSVALRSLGASPVVAAVAPDHPLMSRRRPRLADLSDHPLAVYPWGEGVDSFLEQLPSDAQIGAISPVPAAVQLARERLRRPSSAGGIG